jgi:hypothetical protein
MLVALLAVTAAFSAPPCTHGQLRFALGRPDGAAGHFYFSLVFTNAGSRACTLRGYPGVSSVAGADGHQVGLAAAREKHPVRTVTLRANGGRARAVLDHLDPLVVASPTCHLAASSGWRVYAPGQTRAFFAPKRHQICRRGPFRDRVRPVR